MTVVSVKPLCKCGNSANVIQIDRCPRAPKPATSPAELRTIVLEPEEECWHFSCLTCNSEPDYWVDLSRIKDATKALGWTAHLSEKVWFEATASSWFERMRELFPGMDAA